MADENVKEDRYGLLGPKGAGPCPLFSHQYPQSTEREKLRYLLYKLKRSPQGNEEKVLVDAELLGQTIETLEFYWKLLGQSLNELLSSVSFHSFH